ncbi:MAG: DUF3048 C-terminal domain-containing protein [Nakamurella sp.]
MTTARWLVPVLVLAACSSGEQAAPTSTPTTSAVSSGTTAPPEPPTTTTEVVPTTTEVPVATEPPPPPAPPPVDAMTGGAPSANVVIAAKIDNTFPGDQWGVGDADVVYVEMVEAQLSRLIVLFHTTLPAEIGPVRSVRTTDPDVLTGYGSPALMFSGGAGGPLDNFASSGLVNASPEVIGGSYWRSSAAREPYNLHANVAQVAAAVGGISVPRNPGFTFSDDAGPYAGQRDVSRVSAAFANPISFRWEDGVWKYVRRGSVQSDGATGAVVAFQNLLVQRTTAQKDGTVDSKGVASYKTNTIGSGSFTLYRDGKAVDGTWSRADAASPTSFVDAGGAPVNFRTGKTWVVLAPEQISMSEG